MTEDLGRYASQKGDGKEQIANNVLIRERPVSVEVGWYLVTDKATFMWSRTTVTLRPCSKGTHYAILANVSGRDTETVINAAIRQAQNLQIELYSSLTWSRGNEIADQQRFTLATDMKMYFCDPQGHW